MFEHKIITELKPWIDYSSLKAYLACPRQYWWRYMQNITLAGPKPALVMGSAVHEAIATYHLKQLEGLSFEASVEAGIEAARPIMVPIQHVMDPVRNLTVLVDTLRNYFNYWRTWFITNPAIQVEIVGAIDLGMILFVFKIDGIHETQWGKMVRETKTTTVVGERWPQRVDPNLQIDGYHAAISILTSMNPVGGILDVIPLHQDPKKRKDPFNHPTMRTAKSVGVWAKNVTSLVMDIQRCAERGFFPQNTETCVPLLGYKCEYQLLCSMFHDPTEDVTSPLSIPSEFMFEIWNPMESLENKTQLGTGELR